MLRAVLYGLVAIVAAAAIVIVLAPAQWLALAVRDATHGHVELADADGTIWSGRATVVLGSGADGGARASLAEPMSWKLAPWPLLIGEIDLTLSHPSALAQPLALRATLARQLDLGPAYLRLPASLLTGLGAPWNTIRPGGILVLTWDRLHFEAGRMIGNPSAEWQFASSALTPVSPFGNYRLQTSGGYPGTQLNLVTLAGPLEMTGNGTIGQDGRVRFQGIARAVANADPGVKAQLAGLISLLGRREGDAALLNFGN
jgi:general secretion pathway protein N